MSLFDFIIIIILFFHKVGSLSTTISDNLNVVLQSIFFPSRFFSFLETTKDEICLTFQTNITDICRSYLDVTLKIPSTSASFLASAYP